MTNNSHEFLINLAVIKINWDRDHDLLANFMPLVGYAIKQLDGDLVSVSALRDKILDVAQFHIPSGALEVLIRRASKPRYGYVTKEGYVFRRNLEKLRWLEFERDREAASEQFASISNAFGSFCSDTFPDETPPESASAIFEFMYEFSPRLIASAADFVNDEVYGRGVNRRATRYKAARFISDAIQKSSPHLPQIETFIQGAILAESFYYQSPDSVSAKLRDVRVYYDTNLLSKILGYSSKSESEAANELHSLVRESRAKAYIFEHTKSELHRIFTAASYARRSGPLRAQRPGDVFDWLNLQGYSVSDIELEIARIPDRLDDIGIRLDTSPTSDMENQVGELELSRLLKEEMEFSTDVAINADIDSLQGVFKLRAGKPMAYLDSCKAIFVTTNAALARVSTRYFNSEHGISDAPICITDHVFCMLLWLKTTDKKGGVPRELIVANCIAALQPSKDLWKSYIDEVERLKARLDISETDYVLLAHSLEARQALMDITSRDPGGYVAGSAVDVLEAAKAALGRDLNTEIEAGRSREQQLRAELSAKSDRERRLAKGLGTALYVAGSVVALMFVATVVFFGGLAEAKLIVVGKWSQLDIAGTTVGVLGIILVGVTCANLVFGWAFNSPLRALAMKVAAHILAR